MKKFVFAIRVNRYLFETLFMLAGRTGNEVADRLEKLQKAVDGFALTDFCITD